MFVALVAAAIESPALAEERGGVAVFAAQATQWPTPGAPEALSGLGVERVGMSLYDG